MTGARDGGGREGGDAGHDEPAATRVVLTPEQRAEVDAGRFIRVELPVPFVVTRWVTTKSAIVGRERVGGVVRAYANLCRHQAVPLDLVVDDDDNEAAAGVPIPAPLSEDAGSLVCLRHGALYRLSDGLCTAGPCVGLRLHAIPVEAIDDVVLTLR